MSDPRRTSEYRKQKSAPAQPEREYLPARQPGISSEHDSRQVLNENVRRLKVPELQAPAPVPKLFQAAPDSGPATPRPIAIIDRFHKRGKYYITVSPQHPSQDPDPVPDPAAFHTINDAITFAKTTLVPAMGGNSDDRIKILVFAGHYIETVIIDSLYIDLIGIGRPIIEGQIIIDQDPTSESMICLVDFFDVINPDSTEDDDPRDFAGLIVRRGEPSGDHESNLQFKRCRFRGPKQQAYIERWVDGEDCEFESYDNMATAIPSVEHVCAASIDVSPQDRWSQFKQCRFYGNTVATDIVDPQYFRKGCALKISAFDPITNQWSSNAITHQSGVVLLRCLISGYTINKGWRLKHDHCTHIEGDMLNETSGSIHHYIESFGNSSGVPPTVHTIDAWTWFDSCKFNVRYVACMIGLGNLPLTATCHLYLDHIRHGGVDHATPPIVAGADVIDGTNLVPPQAAPGFDVNCNDYSTAAPFGYAPGGVELATTSGFIPSAPLGIFFDIWEDV